jgi:hypothetical protein
MPVDIINGSSRLREAIDRLPPGSDFDPAALDDWDQDAWRNRIAPHLLYA